MLNNSLHLPKLLTKKLITHWRRNKPGVKIQSKYVIVNAIVIGSTTFWAI